MLNTAVVSCTSHIPGNDDIDLRLYSIPYMDLYLCLYAYAYIYVYLFIVVYVCLIHTDCRKLQRNSGPPIWNSLDAIWRQSVPWDMIGVYEYVYAFVGVFSPCLYSTA